MTERRPFLTIGNAIRDYLRPQVDALVRSERQSGGWKFGGPKTPFEGRSASVSLFVVRLLRRAGQSNWQICEGHLPIGPISEHLPGAGGSSGPANHWWLHDVELDLSLDLTADQFGFPPVVYGREKDLKRECGYDFHGTCDVAGDTALVLEWEHGRHYGLLRSDVGSLLRKMVVEKPSSGMKP